ncbi:YbaK/EbsC family protein [Hoeflea poritis]|uniref:YbaK/EbsC family protein n=1 Tax=Hoeflea poritis TaxID=2993659 RepID=A0ABT4VGK9_9HYPH|nr:YbaK/EbsC family protein [Hoeflea poritis]MDA4843744.1 YbaK/EbsC family protein [Hoeflea poritis]
MAGDTPKRSSMDRVRDSAGELGLDIEIKRMDQSTRTAQEAADACGCDVSQIVKSLIFDNAADGNLILLLVAGNNNADLDHLSGSYGLKLQRCDTRKVRNETGFAIGGVAPIGHIKPIRTCVDRTLLGHDTVWAAAGRPDSVFSVDPKALVAAIDAEIITVIP